MTTTSPSNLPDICSALLAAKAHSGKSFADLAKEMGRDEVCVNHLPPIRPDHSLTMLTPCPPLVLRFLCSFVAAIFYGQAKPTSEDLDKLASSLGGHTAYLTSDALKDPVSGLGENYFPTRGGNWTGPPTDPVLYRLYEILVVYGLPLKQ